MKIIYACMVIIIFFSILMYYGRVPYQCQPYQPREECETGVYRLSIYENPNERNPIAVADAHCVKLIPGRLVAETVRFSLYSKFTRELKDVEFYSEQEFPIDGVEICQIK